MTMMKTPRQIAAESIQKRIAILTEKASNLSWLDELPPIMAEAYVYWGGASEEMIFNFPFDRKLMPVVREALKDAGWRELNYIDEHESVINDWIVGGHYRKNGNFLSVMFTDSVKGSTCKKQRIGVRKVELPIYEYACTQATGEG